LAVGHFGDGNVHYNIAQPIDMPKAEFLARWGELAHAVDEVASRSAVRFPPNTDGIGQMKRRELARVKPAVELDLMRALKAAFDPKGILNPGKLP
jgi:FAD/FMN-containing dehydrogenase